jgi:hypothetical protein
VIDGNGDRKPDYNLEIVTEKGWLPMFKYMAEYETLHPLEDLHLIVWPGNRHHPPNDAPSCGWDNELCPDATRKKYNIIY